MKAVFGRYLRALREGRGLSLKRAAPALSISYTYLSKLENGRQDASDDTLRRLAVYYGVSEDEIALAAGRLPADVQQILEKHPSEAVELLRRKFGR
jgi:transcriptional regulator with XRE-family HTH domain